jgi:hypothetical protein
MVIDELLLMAPAIPTAASLSNPFLRNSSDDSAEFLGSEFSSLQTARAPSERKLLHEMFNDCNLVWSSRSNSCVPSLPMLLPSRESWLRRLKMCGMSSRAPEAPTEWEMVCDDDDDNKQETTNKKQQTTSERWGVMMKMITNKTNNKQRMKWEIGCWWWWWRW